MNPLRAAWLRLKPEAAHVAPAEQLRSALAGALAVLATAVLSALVLESPPFIVASVGASAVVVFALPASPMGQPWPLVGGYLVSAAAGVLAAQLPVPPAVAVALAAGLAILSMLALRCLHPPGGAVALFAVLGGEPVRALGWQYLLTPVLANALLLLAAALLLNNLLPGRRYPRPLPAPEPPAEPPPLRRQGVDHADLRAALDEYGHPLYIGEEELERIVESVERHAFHRNVGELRCERIMSREPAVLRADAAAHEAWRLLRRRHLAQLPVVDAAGRFAGVIALEDFVRTARPRSPGGLRQAIRRLLRRDDARGTVAVLMRRDVPTAAAATPVAELVAPMTRGVHLLPVVDAERRLLGVVTQSDLIAALYHDRLARPE